MSAKLAEMIAEHLRLALDRERSRCGAVAREAVLAEGRTHYEAERIWQAVVADPNIGRHRFMEAEDLEQQTEGRR